MGRERSLPRTQVETCINTSVRVRTNIPVTYQVYVDNGYNVGDVVQIRLPLPSLKAPYPLAVASRNRTAHVFLHATPLDQMFHSVALSYCSHATILAVESSTFKYENSARPRKTGGGGGGTELFATPYHSTGDGRIGWERTMPRKTASLPIRSKSDRHTSHVTRLRWRSAL